MRLGQAARATRAMVTCLLARAARALKYSRRPRRGGDASASENERIRGGQSRHRVGAVDVLKVRWEKGGDHRNESFGRGGCKESESSRRGGCGEGSSPLAYRDPALAVGVARTARPTDRTEEDSTTHGFTNCHKWPVASAQRHCPCARKCSAMSAQMSEEATMSDNAEQKNKQN